MIILRGTIFARKMDKWTFENDRERTQGSVVFKRQTEGEERGSEVRRSKEKGSVTQTIGRKRSLDD